MWNVNAVRQHETHELPSLDTGDDGWRDFLSEVEEEVGRLLPRDWLLFIEKLKERVDEKFTFQLRGKVFLFVC